MALDLNSSTSQEQSNRCLGALRHRSTPVEEGRSDSETTNSESVLQVRWQLAAQTMIMVVYWPTAAAIGSEWDFDNVPQCLITSSNSNKQY